MSISTDNSIYVYLIDSIESVGCAPHKFQNQTNYAPNRSAGGGDLGGPIDAVTLKCIIFDIATDRSNWSGKMESIVSIEGDACHKRMR